jgi:hypothetical protein
MYTTRPTLEYVTMLQLCGKKDTNQIQQIIYETAREYIACLLYHLKKTQLLAEALKPTCKTWQNSDRIMGLRKLYAVATVQQNDSNVRCLAYDLGLTYISLEKNPEVWESATAHLAFDAFDVLWGCYFCVREQDS